VFLILFMEKHNICNSAKNFKQPFQLQVEIIILAIGLLLRLIPYLIVLPGRCLRYARVEPLRSVLSAADGLTKCALILTIH